MLSKEKSELKRKLEKELKQKYRIIESQFDYTDNEGIFALETALALAAIHRREITGLHDLIRQRMPEHIAGKMLQTIEEFSAPLQLSYINPEEYPDEPTFIENFYKEKCQSIGLEEKILLQLTSQLTEEPLTIVNTAFLESENIDLSFTFIMEDWRTNPKFRKFKFASNEMTFYCKRAIFQQKHTEIIRNNKKISQKYKNLMISLRDTYIPLTYDKLFDEKDTYNWLYGEDIKLETPAQRRWIMIAEYIQMLEENGRMSVLVPEDFLQSKSFCKERKFFLSHGCIESVILLPKHLAVMLLCPPYEPASEQKLYFYDASSFRINERTDQPLNQQDVNTILQAIHSEEYAHSVNELNQNCVLMFRDTSRLRLEDISRTITRGAMVLPNRLEEAGEKSSEETDFILLRSQDIEDSVIQLQKPEFFLRTIEASGQYCLKGQETTLLICKNKTRSDSRIRTAVFKDSRDFDGKTFLVTSNIYLLRIDEKKANPYYVQAYLESPEGQKKLRQKLKGSVITTLNISDLREITIPALDMETQNRIADTFRNNLGEIRKCKLRLEELLEQNNQLFKSKTPSP